MANADETQAVTAGMAGTTIQNADEELRPMPDNMEADVTCTDFDRHGDRMVAGCEDHKIRILERDENANGGYKLTDTFRAHNAYIIMVKWHPVKARPAMIASIADDLRLKIWVENVSESAGSGRRYKCIHSQSTAQNVVYTSLSWACPPSITSNTNTYSSVLAAITRDGWLVLLEPVETASASANPNAAQAVGARATSHEEWLEQDQLWIMGNSVPRGVETSFKVAFHAGDIAGVGFGPNYAAVEAGVDERALTLAVTAMDEVRVYLVVADGSESDGHYTFGHPPRSPVAVLSGPADVLVMDINWAPHAWKPRDRLATAWQDDKIRLYEVWALEDNHKDVTAVTTDVKGKAKVRSGIGAGLAGAQKGATDVAPGRGQVPHRWQLVAEIEHDGVQCVNWAREGTILISMSIDGSARCWTEDNDGRWAETAQIGPDTDDWEPSE